MLQIAPSKLADKTVENSSNSICVCSEGVLDLMSGLENSGSSIGVCSEGVLDLMSGLENSGSSIGVCSEEY